MAVTCDVVRLIYIGRKITAGQRVAFVSEGDLNPGTGEISLNMDLNSKTW
jgi:hypothetical protein